MPLDRWPSSCRQHIKWRRTYSQLFDATQWMVFLCIKGEGSAIRHELNDKLLYLQLFYGRSLSNAFRYMRGWSILVLVYESKLLAHLDFHLKQPQGMASPPWPFLKQTLAKSIRAISLCNSHPAPALISVFPSLFTLFIFSVSHSAALFCGWIFFFC